MKRFLSTILLIAAICNVMAQSVESIADAIEIVNDKKIIYVNKLKLPNNISIHNVLCMFPELFGRASDNLSFPKYEIKVDGVSVEGLSNTLVTNLTIHDVWKIEIKESPTASYSKKGAAGTIDIKLNEGTEHATGNISLSGQYPFSIYPSGLYIVKKGKVEIKAIASVEYSAPYKSDTETEEYSISTGQLTNYTVNTKNNNNWIELLRTHINYRPTDNDLLKFCISESYTHNRNIHDITSSNSLTNNSSYSNNFKVIGNTEYEHTFKDNSKLDIEVNYNFNPTREGFDDSEQSLSYANNVHTLNGKAEYVIPLLSPKSKNTLKLTPGSNYKFEGTNDNSEGNTQSDQVNYETSGSYLNLSPYLQVEGVFGKFAFKAIGEYQFDKYRFTNDLYNITNYSTRNDYTYKLMTAWKFHTDHRFRLILDRKLNGLDKSQLFPYLVYTSSPNNFTIGNPKLKSPVTHELKFEYIGGPKFAHSSMMIDASVSYISTEDLIKITSGQIVPNFPYTYTSYINEGNNRAINANLSLIYRAGIMTMALVGEVYFNREEKGDLTDYYNNYNLGLMSGFHFKKNWDLFGRIDYYSNVDTSTGKIGDCVLFGCSGGKTWKRFSLQGYFQVPLTGKTRNSIKGAVNYQYVKYYLFQPECGINLIYRF